MVKYVLARIPAGIWTLGVVSMLMDVSSELIHSLLPLFLVTTLSASALTVGVIEGVAEATALITKVFSGYLSDYFRKRKLLAVLGYGLAARGSIRQGLVLDFARFRQALRSAGKRRYSRSITSSPRCSL